MTVALIDADVIAHRAAAVGSDNVDWGDGQEGPTLNTKLAIQTAHHLIRQWSNKLHTRRIILCFSDKLNFRKALFADYKANRITPKPHHWSPILTSMEAEWEHVRLPGLEADDVMGIYSTAGKLVDPIIVSIDKDMATIPGKLFNPDKDRRPRRITPHEADHYWMVQTLCGDSTDNYKGLPGCGPKGAAKLLDGVFGLPVMWSVVSAAFIDKGFTEADAITQARMARILRRDDYDKPTGRIRAWHPRTADAWMTVEEIAEGMPSTAPATTPTSPSSLSTSSVVTISATKSETSSSTSPVTRTRAKRSKTSKRQGATSTG